MSKQAKLEWMPEIQKMSKRELFEQCKELDGAISDLKNYEAADSDDLDQATGAYFQCVHDFNQHYELLFRRMFRKNKIYRVNPTW